METAINSSRDALIQSLQELTGTLNPKVQAEYLKQDAVYQAKKTYYDAMTVIDRAKEGDPEARKTLAIAAGATAGAVVLLALGLKIKRR